MTDRHADDLQLQAAWSSSGSALAVAAGASIALVSLWCGVPVLIATARGAVAFAGVMLVVRLGAWILPRVRGSGLRRTSAPARPAGKGTRT